MVTFLLDRILVSDFRILGSELSFSVSVRKYFPSSFLRLFVPDCKTYRCILAYRIGARQDKRKLTM